MILWIVFWLAGMLIVLYGIGRSLLSGDLVPVAFMLLWLAAAGFGLYQGVRKLRVLLAQGERQSIVTKSRASQGDLPETAEQNRPADQSNRSDN